MAQWERGREARDARVIYDGADGEAGDERAEHGKGQDAAQQRKEFGLVKAVAGVEYNGRQQVDEEGLGVEGDEKADFLAVVVQVAADDEAEEDGGHGFGENVKFRQQQGMSEEQRCH